MLTRRDMTLALIVLATTLVTAQTEKPASAPTAGKVVVGGGDVHYTVHGSGDRTLMLVHGWTCDQTSWQKVLPGLSRTYRVVTMDLPGHGASAPRPEGAYSMAQFAAALEAVRVATRVESAVLVGHSMGATVITRYAQEHPGRVEALVFADGILADPAQLPQLRKTLVVPRDADEPALRRAFIASMFSPSTTPADKDAILAMMMRAPEVTARGVMAGMLADDALRPDPVTVPGYGIFADRPEMLPMSFVEKMVPGFRHAVLPGTGHFLMIEKPEAFNAALLAFLGTVPRPRNHQR